MYLCSPGLPGLGLLDVVVSADLPGLGAAGLLADGPDLVVAVVVVDDVLHGQGDGGGLAGEGRHAHLGVDGGVGVPAVVLGGVPVVGGGSMGGEGHEGEDSQDDGLHEREKTRGVAFVYLTVFATTAVIDQRKKRKKSDTHMFHLQPRFLSLFYIMAHLCF